MSDSRKADHPFEGLADCPYSGACHYILADGRPCWLTKAEHERTPSPSLRPRGAVAVRCPIASTIVHHRGLAPWPEPLRKLVDEFWPTLCPGGRGHYADHARACSECWTRLLERIVRECAEEALAHRCDHEAKGCSWRHTPYNNACEDIAEHMLERFGLSLEAEELDD